MAKVKVSALHCFRAVYSLYIDIQIGIIGGTGLDDPDIFQDRTEVEVDTVYGKVGLVQ